MESNKEPKNSLSSSQGSSAENPLGTASIQGLLLKFSVPAVISMLVNAVYNMVDQIFIGQGIGMLGVAATNIAFPISTITTATALLFGIGGASNFNLLQGKGDSETAGKVAGNVFSLLAISGLALGAVVMIFLNPLLYFFGATDQIMPYATPYTRIIALGLPFAVFSIGAMHMIRADGSPNVAMASILSGAVFNLIFDPVFLFVFHMGIEGIALATTLGQVLSSAISLFYLLRKSKTIRLNRHTLRPRARLAGMICSLGAASCFNQLAMTVVQIALNNTMKHYGALSVYGSDIPIAVSGVVSKINILFLSLSLGISQGCQPIFSYNYGARNFARVRQAYKAALVAVTLISVTAFACFQLFPRQLISIFGPGTEDYFRFAVQFMRIYMFMTFLNGMQPLTSNFFTSIGKARLGIFLSLTRQFLFLLPLILILPVFLGIEGVLFAAPVADLAAFAFAVIFVSREMRRMTRLEQEGGQLGKAMDA